MPMNQLPSLPAPGGSAASMAQRAFVNMGASGPRTLVSVFPLEQSLKLSHEGTKLYVMPAPTPGGYSTLTVYDTFATCKNFATDQMHPAPVPASVVAENLMHSWTRGRVGTEQGLGPGIVICAGAEPTEAEIKSAMAKQTAYFTYLVNDADAKFSKEGNKNIVSDHRLAAEWLGLKDRKWAKPMVPASDKPCPACGEEIKSTAVICKHCRTDLRTFMEDIITTTPKPKAKPEPKVG